MANKKERQHSRPLAPDLQTYRPTLTMTMSIVHRATGIVLYVGFVGIAACLTTLAAGPRAYETMRRIPGSWVGLAILFVFTLTILHHAFGTGACARTRLGRERDGSVLAAARDFRPWPSSRRGTDAGFLEAGGVPAMRLRAF